MSPGRSVSWGIFTGVFGGSDDDVALGMMELDGVVTSGSALLPSSSCDPLSVSLSSLHTQPEPDSPPPT